MVFKTPFLKKVVVDSYDPAADGVFSWELSNDVLAAVWITVKGDLVQADICIDDLLSAITQLEVTMGGSTIVHYIQAEKAMVMNSKLKGKRPMILGNGQAIDDIMGCCFPILFGAPYLNPKMALPYSKSNRKYINMTIDIANAYVDDILIDIAEVILPGANPIGFIKQEQSNQAAQGTGDKDVWLQRNWDLLKLMIHAPTVPVDAAWTCTVNNMGLEIDDFYYGYRRVPWEIAHGEIMDELGGMAGIENHFHADPSSGDTGHPENLEEWIRNYGEMDFFMEYDLQWKAPLSRASSAKLKLNYGVDEAIQILQANYVPVSKFEAGAV